MSDPLFVILVVGGLVYAAIVITTVVGAARYERERDRHIHDLSRQVADLQRQRNSAPRDGSPP